MLARLGPAPRIAVLRPGRLGDLVVATPALWALRATVPGASITLLTHPQAVPMARRLRSVDEVIVVPETALMESLSRGQAEASVAASLAELRERRFDLVLQCAGGGETTNAFVRAMGARHTAGQQWPASPPLDLWMPYARFQPEVLRVLDVMRLVGVECGAGEPEVTVHPEDITELQRVPAVPHAALARGEVIGVHVGSGSGARRWPPERFATVLDILLAETACTVALVGGSDEIPLTETVLGRLRDRERVVDLAGQLSLGALIALLSRLRLLIGNDSGPAHLATALDVPAVIIYGAGHPSRWAPLSAVWQRAVADDTAPCRRYEPPCGCPDDARALCLAAIRVEDVLTQARAVLALAGTVHPSHAPT